MSNQLDKERYITWLKSFKKLNPIRSADDEYRIGQHNLVDLLVEKAKSHSFDIQEPETPKLIMASKDQQKGGWTISPEMLYEIQEKISGYDDAPSWEGIELVLLAYHGIPMIKRRCDSCPDDDSTCYCYDIKPQKE